MSTKLTYSVALDAASAALALVDADALTTDYSIAEIQEKLDALKTSLAKRAASKSGKPTKAQEAASALGKSIVAEMSADSKLSISDMIKTLPSAAGLSTQKLSPIVAKLVEAGELTVEVVKGRKLYSIAADAEGVED